MHVRIYQPSKSTMQSGRALAGQWKLKPEPQAARTIDPLMGWTSSADTSSQIELTFDSKEAAITHAQRNGWMYSVDEGAGMDRKITPKAYADNFDSDRLMRWTH